MKRTKNVAVRVTAEFKEEFTRHSRAISLPVATYARTLVLQHLRQEGLISTPEVAIAPQWAKKVYIVQRSLREKHAKLRRPGVSERLDNLLSVPLEAPLREGIDYIAVQGNKSKSQAVYEILAAKLKADGAVFTPILFTADRPTPETRLKEKIETFQDQIDKLKATKPDGYKTEVRRLATRVNRAVTTLELRRIDGAGMAQAQSE